MSSTGHPCGGVSLCEATVMSRNTTGERCDFASRGAFTLVEVLIVVIILAILAALVVPKFSNAARLSRENLLRENLRFIRSQIVIYNAEHNNVSPGYPGGRTTATPTEQAFLDQMTKPTNARGEIGDKTSPDHPYGPYLPRMPENPFNEKDTVRIVDRGESFPVAAVGTHGWIYQPSTMKFACDTPGSDEKGVAYLDY
jgi:prepilin-type N-terminal cleavage/methylation domain-containing protein